MVINRFEENINPGRIFLPDADRMGKCARETVFFKIPIREYLLRLCRKEYKIKTILKV